MKSLSNFLLLKNSHLTFSPFSFSAAMQYRHAQSSQSSTYDNRTAQTYSSSQCCLPLLHTSPNLSLSSSLPPSPYAFVQCDSAILIRHVTIVVESIFQTSTANCHFSCIFLFTKKVISHTERVCLMHLDLFYKNPTEETVHWHCAAIFVA